jgi:transposase
MLNLEAWMDVRTLAQQGLSARQIARRTGYSRNTVRKLLAESPPRPYCPAPRPSKVEPFKAYVEQRYLQYGLSAVRLLEEIRPMGYGGSLCILRRFLATLRPQRRTLAKLTTRFETPPGLQAQVDWGSCGRFENAGGDPVSVYVFTIVLGFSRMLYVQFTTSMDLPTLIRCHLDAFAYFDGFPRELLYDNMRQVKLVPAPEGAWNPFFLDFASHYGISPRTCRVRRPRTKGKVERMIAYVKDNLLRGRSFVDLPDLNAQGRSWLAHTANVRVHATTGRRPVELLAAEQLTPLASIAPYQLATRSARKVDAEGFVHLHRSRYSTPPEHVGKTVVVEEAGQRIVIRAGDLIIAEHPRAAKQGACIAQPDHLAALARLSLGDRAPVAAVTPAWHLTFQQGVAARPLSQYEEAGA